MLSFPTPSWKKVAISTLKSSSAHQSGLPLGRTASLILPRLYLSDFFTARDEEAMTKLGITHMVSVMENMPTQMPQMVRYHIPIQDKGDADILQHLDGTTEFIREALSENPNNKVLVHCLQGISRSATVVCAFVIAQAANGMTAAEAIDMVKAKRGIICPNLGFRVQLDRYSERFVGNRVKHGTSIVAAVRRTSRLSDGIAERIRRFKASGSVVGPVNTLNEIEVEEGA